MQRTFLLLLIMAIAFGSVALDAESYNNPSFDWVGEYADGLAPARMGNKYGYINTNREIIIPFHLKAASVFKDGQAMVMVGDNDDAIVKINTSGQVVGTFEDLLENNPHKWELETKDYYVLASSGLSIRDKPGTEGTRLIVAPYKSKVKYISSTDIKHIVEGIASHWVMVEYNGVKGYAFYGFLTHIDLEKFNYFFHTHWLREKHSEGIIMKMGARESVVYLEDSGLVLTFYSMEETCARSQTMYMPGYNIHEAFLLVKAAVSNYDVITKKERVLQDYRYQDEITYVPVKDYPFPGDDNFVRMLLNNDTGEQYLTIEQKNNGYIMIKY